MTNLQIDNNELLGRFEALVNGRRAVLDYRIENETLLLLYVEVPREEQGRGIAGSLTKAALRFGKDKGLKIVPYCPYIAAYMRAHPEDLS